MNLLLRAAAPAALLLPLAVAPATAQNYRGAWGLYGGGIWFSDLNNGGPFDNDFFDFDFDDDIDFIEGFGTSDLSLDLSWLAGTQFEYWFGNGRFGLRANGAYTSTDFDVDDGLLFGIIDNEIDGDDFFFLDGDDGGSVNVWLIDGDVMIRILRPERDRRFAPFVSLGAGVVIYNPAGDGTLVFPGANAVWGDVADIDIIDDEIVLITDDNGNSETKFAGVIGLGTDFFPGWNLGNIGLGLRLELADHIAFDSPVDPLFNDGDDDDFDPVHNVRLTLGVHALFGKLFPEEEVAIVQPAPPAPPAEEAITVCVLDPRLQNGIRDISAIYVPSTGDTLVMVNGNRVPLDTQTGRVMVAQQADWYVRGQPLTITANGQTAEFVTYGGARIVDANDLAFIGTVNGLPVYAEASEARALSQEMEQMREARREGSLEDVLERRADLREDFEDIEVLYVPVDPVGCVVQPVRRVEEVRKVRG